MPWCDASSQTPVCVLTTAAKRKGFFDLYGEAGLKDGVQDAQGGARSRTVCMLYVRHTAE